MARWHDRTARHDPCACIAYGTEGLDCSTSDPLILIVQTFRNGLGPRFRLRTHIAEGFKGVTSDTPILVTQQNWDSMDERHCFHAHGAKSLERALSNQNVLMTPYRPTSRKWPTHPLHPTAWGLEWQQCVCASCHLSPSSRSDPLSIGPSSMRERGLHKTTDGANTATAVWHCENTPSGSS